MSPLPDGRVNFGAVLPGYSNSGFAAAGHVQVTEGLQLSILDSIS